VSSTKGPQTTGELYDCFIYYADVVTVRCSWAWATCRGTPGAPGRTVTLEHSPEHAVYGAAYLLSGTAEEQQSTLKVLTPPLPS